MLKTLRSGSCEKLTSTKAKLRHLGFKPRCCTEGRLEYLWTSGNLTSKDTTPTAKSEQRPEEPSTTEDPKEAAANG